MNRFSLLFKIIKQLKSKAAVLVLITLVAEAAVVYLAGLYNLPKQYQRRFAELSKSGCVYFDTLGRKTDVEALLANEGAVEDVLYVNFIANVKYNGEYYFLRAVSSEKCFGVSLNKKAGDDGKTLKIAGSRQVLDGNGIGEKVRMTLLVGNDPVDAEFEVGGILSEDALVLNFNNGSNAASAYSIFSQCGNDIYVFGDEPELRLLAETASADESILYPGNGIVLFKEGADQSSRIEVIRTLLANDVSVQEDTELEERTRLVSKNSIDTYSAIPLLIMALSLASTFAIIVMSIDSEAKTISLIELVGCSKAMGTGLLISAFSILLIPGVIVNGGVIFAVVAGGKQLIDNVLITCESFLLLGGTVLAFLAIIALTSVLLKRQNSHVQRVIEEI
ncbi:MAG: hypothetical protein IJS71_09800 [Clostridia bacterium]|nr:hypothetical protein [Clostridia bacterium]